MSFEAFQALAIGLVIVGALALVAALVSLVLVVVRWRAPQRGKHVARLLLFLAVVPCCLGIYQAVKWGLFVPSRRREESLATRAAALAETSLVRMGDAAPDFTLTRVDGSTFSLSGAKGKVVLINFFATWCGPCALELPHIESLWKEYRDHPKFELLVIDREESNQVAEAYRNANGYTFPVAGDPRRAAFALYAKDIVPWTILVSPTGQIAYIRLGFDEGDASALEAAVEEQLAGGK